MDIYFKKQVIVDSSPLAPTQASMGDLENPTELAFSFSPSCLFAKAPPLANL